MMFPIWANASLALPKIGFNEHHTQIPHCKAKLPLQNITQIISVPILYLKRQQKVHPAKRFEILRPRQHGLLSIFLSKNNNNNNNKGIGDAGSTADMRILWSAKVCLGIGLQ